MKWDRTVWKDGLCSRSQFLGYVTVWNLCADIWMERIFLCQILGATVLLYAAGIICGIESCGQSISRNDARCVACSYYLLNRELLKSADNPVALGLQVIYQIKLVCLVMWALVFLTTLQLASFAPYPATARLCSATATGLDSGAHRRCSQEQHYCMRRFSGRSWQLMAGF